MDWQEESSGDFHCAKCRNTTAIVRKINLAKGILPELLARGGSRYRLVTCGLCGYTEIYDLAVYAKKQALETREDKAADLAPET
jgi:predicted nucleic-acid-binding Zn-ribbon protein